MRCLEFCLQEHFWVEFSRFYNLFVAAIPFSFDVQKLFVHQLLWPYLSIKNMLLISLSNFLIKKYLYQASGSLEVLYGAARPLEISPMPFWISVIYLLKRSSGMDFGGRSWKADVQRRTFPNELGSLEPEKRFLRNEPCDTSVVALSADVSKFSLEIMSPSAQCPILALDMTNLRMRPC